MALTDAQKLTLHEILRIPDSSKVTRLMGNENTLGEQSDVSNSLRASLIFLNDYLDTMSAAVESRVVQLITRWDELGTCTVSINGSVGAVSGVANDPANERELIYERMQIHVPFWKHFHQREQAMKRQINMRVVS